MLRTDALETINTLRTSFDGEPVDEIDPGTVREGLESPAEAVSTQALQRERPRKELNQFVDWIGDLRADLPEQIDRLDDLINEYREKPPKYPRRSLNC
jgi:hypothetical protein